MTHDEHGASVEETFKIYPNFHAELLGLVAQGLHWSAPAHVGSRYGRVSALTIDQMGSLCLGMGRQGRRGGSHCRVLRAAGTQGGSVDVGDGHASVSGRLRLWDSRATC